MFNARLYIEKAIIAVLRYASHVACLHVLSACAGAQNPVSALNSNASSLPPLQCNHFVTSSLNCTNLG
jgi:hypothetical protein